MFFLYFTVFVFLLFIAAGEIKKKQLVLDLSLDSWLYSGEKIPIRDASYITFLCLLFLVWVNFFDSSLSTSAGMCGMWCCSITGSLNVRSCRDKRTRRQKVNGATAMGGGGTSGGMAWWKCMLGRINGSSNTRMPAAETGQECSHHSNSPPPGNEVVQLLQMSVHGWTCLLGMKCWCVASRGSGGKTQVSSLPTFAKEKSTKW